MAACQVSENEKIGYWFSILDALIEKCPNTVTHWAFLIITG